MRAAQAVRAPARGSQMQDTARERERDSGHGGFSSAGPAGKRMSGHVEGVSYAYLAGHSRYPLACIVIPRQAFRFDQW